MEGMQSVAGERDIYKEVGKDLEAIFSQFQQETQQRCLTLATVEEDKLRKLGIAGSAVKPNLRVKENWQQERSRIRQSYDLRLNKLRKALMQQLEAI